MISVFERQEDILKLIERLDISPTMYINAEEKYHALSSFLEDCGIEAEIYPQGSFAFGTVVRPSAKDPNAAYDLDFVCQLKVTRDQISPSELRHKIEYALKSSDLYSGKLHIWEECFTIEYADINGISFAIDIVPASAESLLRKEELKLKSSRPDLLDTAIAIPCHIGKHNYCWITNNPRGFQKWFEEINQPFFEYNRESRRQSLYKANSLVFASVDDIPVGLERSSLQRVIQILKYHRDVYYTNLPREDSSELKPISAIINTVVAQIAKSAPPHSSVFDLLDYVLKELAIYARYQKMNYIQFNKEYNGRSVITKSKTENRWIIQNPADPEDNLADKWNENADIPKYFFLWISACETDLIISMGLSDSQFRTNIENAFGVSTVQNNWGDKYKSTVRATPQSISTSPKPYMP